MVAAALLGLGCHKSEPSQPAPEAAAGQAKDTTAAAVNAARDTTAAATGAYGDSAAAAVDTTMGAVRDTAAAMDSTMGAAKDSVSQALPDSASVRVDTSGVSADTTK
jgi:hypothetical protein